MNTPRAPLKTLDEALAELLGHAAPLAGQDSVSTFDADGRVLARDLVSALQVPPQDNSSMDGYAVRAAEIAAGFNGDAGMVLPVSQRIAAGNAGAPLAPGSLPEATLRPVLNLNDPEALAAWLVEHEERFEYRSEAYL